MNAVERLEAIEEIKQLKARYFRCMDTKDWDGFTSVFAPDARMDVTGELSDDAADGRGVTTGNREIAAFVRASIDEVTTAHHGHTPEIDVTSPTSATGIWAMEDHLWWPEGSPISRMHGYGHYRETYEKVDGRWLITSTTPPACAPTCRRGNQAGGRARARRWRGSLCARVLIDVTRRPGQMMAANIGSGDVLLWLVEFFLFLIYFWLLVVVIGDLFRDHELSGWAKALWVLFLIVAPMFGVLVYLIFRGQGMGRRSAASARAAQDRFDTYVRDAAGGGQSPTEQIAHAKSLLDSGAIDQGEYDQLKAKALA